MEASNKFDGLIDELVKSGKTLDELMAEGGELRQLYKRLAERTLEAEMAIHLGYEPHASSTRQVGLSRLALSHRNPTRKVRHVELHVYSAATKW